MKFGESIRYGFTNYANFSGVVGRSTFWYWYLFSFIVSYGLSLLQTVALQVIKSDNLGLFAIVAGLSGIASLGLTIPTLALMVRRLRDAGYSPLYLLLILAPIVMTAVFAVFGAVLGVAAVGGSDLGNGIGALGGTVIGAIIGAIVGGIGASIWLIVLLAKPTRTRAQGNRYAIY